MDLASPAVSGTSVYASGLKNTALHDDISTLSYLFAIFLKLELLETNL